MIYFFRLRVFKESKFVQCFKEMVCVNIPLIRTQSILSFIKLSNLDHLKTQILFFSQNH